MGKIIKPSGLELKNYVNDGYAICNKCGALMDHEKQGRDIILICPSCGDRVNYADYEYEGDPDDDDEWTDQMMDMFDGDVPPAGCMACGGPYPQCKISCNLFDD